VVLPGQRDALGVVFLIGGDQGVARYTPEARARRGAAIECFENGA